MARRKMISAVLAVVMLLALLAGCGSTATSSSSAAASSSTAASSSSKASSSSAAASSSSAASATGKKVSLDINIVQTDWQAHWDEMKSKFETANPNITLNSVGVGESNDSFITKRQASGDMPDVMQVNNNDVFRAIVDKGLLKDVSDTDGAKHTPKSYLDAYTYNGTCFGVFPGRRVHASVLQYGSSRQGRLGQGPDQLGRVH